MSKDREDALKRLKESLTATQIEDLQFVIQTAETQGSWDKLPGEDTMFQDDIQATLNHLSYEFTNE